MTESDSQSLSQTAAPAVVIPGWAKFFAAIAAIFLVAGAVGGAIGISWFRQQALSSVNPQFINATLQSMGKFDDLSAYHPVIASNVAGAPVVAFDEKEKDLQFVLVSFESPDTDPDPIEIIDNCYDKPALFPRVTGRFTSIADKGKTDIHGHQFSYLTGVLQGGDGNTYKGMIGCLTVGRKVVLIEAAALAKHPLDMDFLLDFLRKAHSF